MRRTISSRVPIAVSFDTAVDLLVRDPIRFIVGDPASGDAGTVELPASLAGIEVAQRVHVTVGPPSSREDDLVVGLRWDPLARSRVLPSFEGVLSVVQAEPAVLELHGSYDVPLAMVGAFGDGLIGHRVARATLERLLEAMAGRCSSHAPAR